MKSLLYPLTCLALAGSLAGTAVAQDSFSSLEEQMTGKEFSEAGLDKLSDEELAALNAWLRSHSVGTLDAPNVAYGDQGDMRGFESRESRSVRDSGPIQSTIKGEFTGWDGNTVFELENGMIWKQDEKDTFFIRPIIDPQVVIEPGVFGTWRLSVVGYGSSVRVQRIQ